MWCGSCSVFEVTWVAFNFVLLWYEKFLISFILPHSSPYLRRCVLRTIVSRIARLCVRVSVSVSVCVFVFVSVFVNLCRKNYDCWGLLLISSLFLQCSGLLSNLLSVFLSLSHFLLSPKIVSFQSCSFTHLISPNFSFALLIITFCFRFAFAAAAAYREAHTNEKRKGKAEKRWCSTNR